MADALPKGQTNQWAKERDQWLSHHPQPWDEETESLYHQQFSDRMDHWLDQGAGSCVLRDTSLAMIMGNSLRHFDRARYRLSDYVVMPNHVHVLFQPLGDHRLADIVKSWKGFSAREINKRLERTTVAGRLLGPVNTERRAFSKVRRVYPRESPKAAPV